MNLSGSADDRRPARCVALAAEWGVPLTENRVKRATESGQLPRFIVCAKLRLQQPPRMALAVWLYFWLWHQVIHPIKYWRYRPKWVVVATMNADSLSSVATRPSFWTSAIITSTKWPLTRCATTYRHNA
jgi:hypothetical protein